MKITEIHKKYAMVYGISNGDGNGNGNGYGNGDGYGYGKFIRILQL